MKLSIEALKKEGALERLRKEISSLTWGAKNMCETIYWSTPKKEMKKKLKEIRENLDMIETLFDELQADNGR